jgi:hypothetical protein
VQANLNGFKARLRVEAPYAGDRYAELVAATTADRRPMITQAWNADPVDDDTQVHNPSWDFSELGAYDDDAYVQPSRTTSAGSMRRRGESCASGGGGAGADGQLTIVLMRTARQAPRPRRTSIR